MNIGIDRDNKLGVVKNDGWADISDWHCELFGCGNQLHLRPVKGHEPNWFWRLMQYLILGNKWIKD